MDKNIHRKLLNDSCALHLSWCVRVSEGFNFKSNFLTSNSADLLYKYELNLAYYDRHEG